MNYKFTDTDKYIFEFYLINMQIRAEKVRGETESVCRLMIGRIICKQNDDWSKLRWLQTGFPEPELLPLKTTTAK